MTTVGTIEMQGIRAIGRHGVLPEEQRRAQPFEIDVRMTLDITAAVAGDSLDHTVDYGLLAEAVARTVELQHHNLLETLAAQIGRVCLGSGKVDSVEVTVRKLRPPVAIHIETVGVTVVLHAGTDLDLPSTDTGVDVDPATEVVTPLDEPGAPG